MIKLWYFKEKFDVGHSQELKRLKVLTDCCCCFQSEAKLVDELRASFEKQYNDELEKARREWKEEEVSKIKDEFMKEKEQLLKVWKQFGVLRFVTLFCQLLTLLFQWV